MSVGVIILHLISCRISCAAYNTPLNYEIKRDVMKGVDVMTVTYVPMCYKIITYSCMTYKQ